MQKKTYKNLHSLEKKRELLEKKQIKTYKNLHPLEKRHIETYKNLQFVRKNTH